MSKTNHPDPLQDKLDKARAEVVSVEREILLRDLANAKPVTIAISISLEVKENYAHTFKNVGEAVAFLSDLNTEVGKIPCEGPRDATSN